MPLRTQTIEEETHVETRVEAPSVSEANAEETEPVVTKKKKVKQRSFARLYIGGMIVSTLISVAVGFLLKPYFDNDVASNELPAAAEAYRKAGLPWEASEVALSPPVADADNAGPELQKAAKIVNDLKIDSDKISKLLDAGDLSGAQRMIAPLDPALNLARLASLKPGLDFHRDWDLGNQILFPEYDQMKGLVKLLGTRAEIEARTHDFTDAHQDLATMRRMSRMLNDEPILIGMLVQIAQDAITLRAIERVAYEERSNPSALQNLSRLMNEIEPKPNMSAAMRGEAYIPLADLRNLSPKVSIFSLLRPENADEAANRTSEDTTAPPIQRTGYPQSVDKRALLARDLQAWTKIGVHMKQGVDDPRILNTAFEGEERFLESQRGQSYLFAQTRFPVFSQASSAAVRDRAYTLCMKALLEAIQIRQNTGSFPATLDDIPGKWIDPFNGKPLHLKHTVDGGLRIWSVGEDLVDNGGIAKVETHSSHDKYDDVASYPPVKPWVAPKTITSASPPGGPLP